MSANDTPEIIMVPLPRLDINLTLEEVLTPLEQASTDLAVARPGTAVDPELAQRLHRLSELAGELRSVVNQINSMDPTLLAPGQGDSGSPSS